MKSIGRKGNVKGIRMVKEETRVPLAVVHILDCSGSMSVETRIIDEKGGEKRVSKIGQMQEGFRESIESMLRFERENTKFRLIHQVISLDSYGKALFDGYKPISDPQYDLREVEFAANGVTNMEASLNTLAKYITIKELGHYNRMVNVIMMSDGVPTDVNGYPLKEAAWKKMINKLRDYLDKNDLDRSVTFYFIAIGDEAEPFGRYLAGDDHFFKVSDCENIAEKLDFVTRQSLAESTTVTGDPIGYGQSFDEDEDEDEDFPVYDEDEDEDEDDYDDPDVDTDDDYDDPDVDTDDDFDEPDVDTDDDFDEPDEEDDEEDEEDEEDDDDDDDGSLDTLLDF